MSGGRNLRHGYTTGATAAAAAKAAVRLLLGEPADSVTLSLPWGSEEPREVSFSVVNPEIREGSASAGVIKDGGDDPDATHKMEIRATVSFDREGGGTVIEGGEGVGRVTRAGLAQPVGSPAINPVPQAMIRKAVEEAFGGRPLRPVRVVISAPEGVERAKRTMNSRLGILGGISILGTTGIVIPMSTAAWTATIDACLDVAKAAGAPKAILAFGRTSERAGQTLYPELAANAAVLMGDHVGYSLDSALKRGMDVVIVGQFAKFCKLASGNYETNVKDSALDLHLLERLMSECGFGAEEARGALGANTAREVYVALRDGGDRGLFALLTETVARRAFDRVDGGISVEAVLFGYAGELVSRFSLTRKAGCG